MATSSVRYGIVSTGAPHCVARCGTVGAVFDQNVTKFSLGNLSNDLRTGSTNVNWIEAASDPAVRSIGQAIIPPVLILDRATGQIITSTAGRVTSGFGTRDPGVATGSTNHPAIDFNRDISNPNAIFTSPIKGTVVTAQNGLIVIESDGHFHKFLHGTNAQVTVGQEIAAGAVLGTISNLNASTGRVVQDMPAHVDYRVGTTRDDLTQNLVAPSEY